MKYYWPYYVAIFLIGVSITYLLERHNRLDDALEKPITIPAIIDSTKRIEFKNQDSTLGLGLVKLDTNNTISIKKKSKVRLHGSPYDTSGTLLLNNIYSKRQVDSLGNLYDSTTHVIHSLYTTGPLLSDTINNIEWIVMMGKNGMELNHKIHSIHRPNDSLLNTLNEWWYRVDTNSRYGINWWFIKQYNTQTIIINPKPE